MVSRRLNRTVDCNHNRMVAHISTSFKMLILASHSVRCIVQFVMKASIMTQWQMMRVCVCCTARHPSKIDAPTTTVRDLIPNVRWYYLFVSLVQSYWKKKTTKDTHLTATSLVAFWQNVTDQKTVTLLVQLFKNQELRRKMTERLQISFVHWWLLVLLLTPHVSSSSNVQGAPCNVLKSRNKKLLLERLRGTRRFNLAHFCQSGKAFS